MHFEKEQLPPVQAFRSVSLYEEGNATPNPLNRRARRPRPADIQRVGAVITAGGTHSPFNAGSFAIPKVRPGTCIPSLLQPRRRAEQALVAVVQEAYAHGVSTRKVDDLLSQELASRKTRPSANGYGRL